MDLFPTVVESVRDLNDEQVQWLLNRTGEFKRISHSSRTPGLPQSPLRLPGHPLKCPIVACTFFEEHSTRTKLSFMRALQLLGADFVNFDSGTSSLKKGESLRETFLTLKAMGVNLLILRTPTSFGLSPFKEKPFLSMINAGDGINEHPTQALLDAFTMMENEGDLKGKTVAILGDVVHSRVSHSLIHLLPKLGAKVMLVGPSFFLPTSTQYSHIEVCNSRDEAINRADILYLLRIQTERHGEKTPLFSIADYIRDYGVTYQLLKKHQKMLPLYSPGPANIGVEIDEEAIQSELFRGHIQVENGVYMRMSLIEAMFLK